MEISAKVFWGIVIVVLVIVVFLFMRSGSGIKKVARSGNELQLPEEAQKRLQARKMAASARGAAMQSQETGDELVVEFVDFAN